MKNIKSMVSIALLSFMAVSLIACGGGGSDGGLGLTPAPAPPPPFSSTDIGGTWALVDGSITGVTYGSVDISGTGSVTGGTWTMIGGSTGTYTGGTVSVSGEGAISGSVIASGPDTHTVQGGQMSLDKDLLVYAAVDTPGNAECGIAINATGSYATTDLQGTWRWGTPLAYGTFVVDGSGNVTSGTVTHIGVESGTITGGTFTITAQGTISGTFSTSEPVTYTLQSGRMNSAKNVAYLAITPPSNGGGLIAVKMNGSFTPGTDIAGTYKFASIVSNGVVAYGSIIIVSSSTITGGTSTEIGVGSGTFTGGTISISTQGVLTGSVSTSTGDVHVIGGGQLNSSKTVAFAVDVDTSANTELSVFVKTP